jgi:hypothetical protein
MFFNSPHESFFSTTSSSLSWYLHVYAALTQCDQTTWPSALSRVGTLAARRSVWTLIVLIFRKMLRYCRNLIDLPQYEAGV